MSVDMTPPPTVVEFAEKSGYTNGVKFIREWQGYKVYAPDYSAFEGESFGLPNFILINDSSIRWNTREEQEKLLYLGNKEDSED